MINAYRRGVQTASEEAAKYPPNLPAKEIKTIAHRTFSRMKQANFAHIEPEEEFVQGFTERFLQTASHYLNITKR
jgi:hypothetical protein